jgi:hypothetical protein
MQEEKHKTRQEHLDEINRLNADHAAKLQEHNQYVAKLNKENQEKHQ